jgi:non-ribosomal peptide synthase protein (TIGR01720 family)
VLLQVHQRLDPLILKETVKQLIAQHPTIGLRFERNPYGWQQALADVQVDQVFHWHDLSALPAASQSASVEQHSASYQSSLDLSNGPLLRIVYFDLGPDQPARLLLLAHHLVIDGVSWRILLEDMQTIYHHLEQHSTPPRLPPSVSYLQWAKQLSEAAHSSWLQDQLPYWLEMSRRQAPHLPLDDPDGANTEETASSILVELTPEETQLLLRLIPELYGADIQDALLAALAQAYAEWSNGRELLLDLEHHGREAFLDDLDLSRTVGWFTSIFPVRFELHNPDDPDYALKSIKEQLRRVPQKGLGFGLLRYLHPEWKTEFSRSPGLKPMISFNYLGQFDSLFSQQGTFSLAPEQTGPARSPKSHRPHLISLNGGIYQNRLRVEWTFSRAIHKPETIAWLTERFLVRMREIIRACQQKQEVEYTPADFQDIDLSDGEIDALLREIGSSGS